MDADLYDEFGNYIGPELESDEEDDNDSPRGFQKGTDRSPPPDQVINQPKIHLDPH